MGGGGLVADGASSLAGGGAGGSGGLVDALWPDGGWRSAAAWGALAYGALGPGALADVLMQRAAADPRMSAPRANVLLASEPLFASGFAAVLLGERLGPVGLAGGAAILGASVIAGGSSGDEEGDAPA